MPKLQVQDLMTEKVYSIREDEDLARLHDLMNDLNVRHVPVTDDDGNLKGVVSHRDLLSSVLYSSRELPQNEVRELMRTMTVGEIMVSGVETADPEQAIEEAGMLMLENKLGCLPVVDGERLVGILTEADFVKYVVEQVAE